ncbi:MAG: hypothetical protein ACPGO5_04835 [Patescibacteria group bacterium]
MFVIWCIILVFLLLAMAELTYNVKILQRPEKKYKTFKEFISLKKIWVPSLISIILAIVGLWIGIIVFLSSPVPTDVGMYAFPTVITVASAFIGLLVGNRHFKGKVFFIKISTKA